MKAFIFEPLWHELITPDLMNDLEQAGISITVITEAVPLSDCAQLFEGDEDRLLYVSPDSVGWKLTSDDYKTIPNLKSIFVPVTAFSWIDATYANERNIPICNIKGYSAEAVAEWAVMMMLNLARQTPRIIKDGYPLDFGEDFMKYRGIELHGKTAGIIGLGDNGKAIAKRCKGLGMHIVYWSKNSRSDEYEYVELAQLMSTADVIFPVMAINEESKGLIIDDLLRSMKPTTILIEEAHNLFNRDLVLQMVQEGRLFGFGFEAAPESFAKYEGNVWAAPEYGWATDRAMLSSVEMQVKNMVAATKGEFPNRVN